MRSLFIILIAFAIILPSFARTLAQARRQSNDDYPAQWREARLNNFNPADRTTYSQRFYINDDYYYYDSTSNDYPVWILEIGEEGEMTGPAQGVIAFAIILPSFARTLAQARRQSNDDYPAQWREARLNNFNPADRTTYSQRFYINDDYYYYDSTSNDYPRFYINDDYYYYDSTSNDYPVWILEIGEEGEMTGPAQGGDEISTLAQYFNARIYGLEHRFYGQSQPFNDLTTDHLRYLTPEQALADVAGFIDEQNQAEFPNDYLPGKPFARIITVGGSYAGGLSAWFRLKYPHLAVASLASSGVVNAIKHFVEFDQQHRLALQQDENCDLAARYIIRIAENYVSDVDLKTEYYDNLNLDANMDVGDAFYISVDSMVMAAQYGHQEELCGRIVDPYNSGDDDALMDAYYDFFNNWWTPNMNPNGSDAYDANHLKEDGPDMLTDPCASARTWWFEKCATNFYWQISDGDDSIRSPTYTTEAYHRDMCKRVFGDPFTDDDANYVTNNNETNYNFGGGNYNGEKVVFYNSWQDPWNRAGVTITNDYKRRPVEFVKAYDVGHCQDLHNPSDDDAQGLKMARNGIRTDLEGWVDDSLYFKDHRGDF
ncbi:Peptidase S28 like protein [Aduncisulcus paluster]|uniref:Peptidase S28 like protein n=1 Tax=Aduncisulcus paluster TaxID=2918883 RepID=A0ABQ5KZR3_9EUKA|nr:Peptidase S28 like protein [Aduncisulcus paluster]